MRRRVDRDSQYSLARMALEVVSEWRTAKRRLGIGEYTRWLMKRQPDCCVMAAFIRLRGKPEPAADKMVARAKEVRLRRNCRSMTPE